MVDARRALRSTETPDEPVDTGQGDFDQAAVETAETRLAATDSRNLFEATPAPTAEVSTTPEAQRHEFAAPPMAALAAGTEEN